MKTATMVKNWVIGETPEVLKNIHQNNVNITIYNRDISTLKKEINSLLEQDIEFNSSGNIKSILKEITEVIELGEYSVIKQDIKNLLDLFKEVTNAKDFQLLLGVVNTDMCRKFHMDNNNLRMLCTYSGPGTLWLTENNINRKVLESRGSNQFIVIDKNIIKQASTGSVVILKGVKYSKETTKAAVHRSPTIEESGEKRLLLRIDIN